MFTKEMEEKQIVALKKELNYNCNT